MFLNFFNFTIWYRSSRASHFLPSPGVQAPPHWAVVQAGGGAQFRAFADGGGDPLALYGHGGVRYLHGGTDGEDS